MPPMRPGGTSLSLRRAWRPRNHALRKLRDVPPNSSTYYPRPKFSPMRSRGVNTLLLDHPRPADPGRSAARPGGGRGRFAGRAPACCRRPPVAGRGGTAVGPARTGQRLDPQQRALDPGSEPAVGVARRLEGGRTQPGIGLRGRAVLGDQRLGSRRRAGAVARRGLPAGLLADRDLRRLNFSRSTRS